MQSSSFLSYSGERDDQAMSIDLSSAMGHQARAPFAQLPVVRTPTPTQGEIRANKMTFPEERAALGSPRSSAFAATGGHLRVPGFATSAMPGPVGGSASGASAEVTPRPFETCVPAGVQTANGAAIFKAKSGSLLGFQGGARAMGGAAGGAAFGWFNICGNLYADHQGNRHVCDATCKQEVWSKERGYFICRISGRPVRRGAAARPNHRKRGSQDMSAAETKEGDNSSMAMATMMMMGEGMESVQQQQQQQRAVLRAKRRRSSASSVGAGAELRRQWEEQVAAAAVARQQGMDAQGFYVSDNASMSMSSSAKVPPSAPTTAASTPALPSRRLQFTMQPLQALMQEPRAPSLQTQALSVASLSAAQRQRALNPNCSGLGSGWAPGMLLSQQQPQQQQQQQQQQGLARGPYGEEAENPAGMQF